MKMQNLQTKTSKTATNVSKRLISFALFVALLIQVLSVCCFAATDGEPLLNIESSQSGGIVNGVGKFDSDETVAELKKDLLASINRDLVKKIDDYELNGEVGAIISFSDNSLVKSFTDSAADKMTFDEYRVTSDASKLKDRLAANQTSVLGSLANCGLISDVKHNYYNIMDGAYVRTTYENIEAICEHEGVERVIISNTYLPAVAVENPVDVYDTGIFNSSDISYTGKGTIVAILDSGCDYTHSAFTTHEVVDPLYDRDEIAELLPGTVAYSYNELIEVREVYYGNITGGKIAFGYDYADKDTDIMPFTSSHGTHVAGIIGGMDDKITGVAIDTQLAIMKVFSDYDTGAEDGDILAALEDSVTLGVDAINMSLGSSCGFSREVDDEYKNTIYDSIEAAGISLIVAASNDYSSGFGGEEGNTNKTDNPDSATVGSPSTYESAMSVASINGRKENYILVNGNTEVFFNEAYNMASDEYSFFEMLGLTKENTTAEFEYVTIPGYGYAINYTGLDIEGKVALVKRGDITFEEKVQYAYEAGAAGIIIYNNIGGEISMTVGNDLKIPVVSISKDDGDAMAALGSGKIVVNFENEAGPFMSDFSSWGPTPNLSLKPEITAHGGNILSSVAGGEYEEQSGTSMASPNMCGIVVLIRQYVKEKYSDLSATEVRDLVNQLCMSTATIALDKKGNPYSPRKQGAGIADIAKATTTPAYLYVLEDGTGKTKLELGDDPTRSGVYTMTVYLKNLSDESVSYRLGNITMTESVSTSEPEYVAEMAYLLSNSTEYKVSGGELADGVVSVAAGATASVTVTITLSAKDKSYLNSTFANGMYVEGFLTFDSTEEDGIDLNAPFLAFYGDWGEAPIFDLDYYEVETEAHNNAIDDDDKIKADYYATTPLGTYYYDYIIPLGSYVYEMDESLYTPIPAVEEHAAVSYFAESISGIYGVFTGLLRGAKELNISIVDTATGKEVWSKTEYNCYKAHYGGAAFPYVAKMDVGMADFDSGTVFGNNNTRYEVTMSAKLDWDSENRNSSDTYSFSFYIDYEAPSVVDATFRTEYDKSREENRYYVDLMVYDNHYAMSIRPIIAYDFVESDGEVKKTYSSLIESPIPIYQENRGEATKVTLEITDYLDIITNSACPEGLTLYIDDYAMNAGVAYVPFPETESTDLEFLEPELPLDINDTFDLTTYLVHEDTTTPVTTDFLKALDWSSSDESVVAICDGKIEALKSGSAVISVTGDTWKTADGVQISKSIVVNVSDTVKDNPDSSQNVPIESLQFSSYYTMFAFNSDIDYSEIGLTDTTHYFGGNYNLSFYPSEQVKLNYDLQPWNLAEDRYTLKWASSNPKVATVDENGVVTAESEGLARITLQITFKDGQTSLLAARCSIEVKSEFIIENRTLVAYKGKGGDVVIPDDEGIMTIGAFAFCHYNLDNEKEVEKDENGYYDIDLKKEPLGNDTVTSVVIPEGVETIEKYAFYNCRALSNVTLPSSCKTINEYAFANCSILENVNFESVKVISNYGFYMCKSLSCENLLGGADLSGVYAVGDYAFAGARFNSIKLSNLSLTGVGAFSDCIKLTDVELGTKTRISKSMFENSPIGQIVVYSDTVGDAAFKGCTELTSVEFKNDLTYLGSEVFMGCKELESVTFDGVCEQIASFAFSDCASLETLTLPSCEVILGDGVFSSSALKTLVFAENTLITGIGIGTFDRVKGFGINADESVHYTLSGNALYTADGTTLVMLVPSSTVKGFTVPASVKYIYDGAFSSNNYITSISFESGSLIESIGYGAFSSCTSLQSITFPENGITIGTSAFFNTPSLRSVNLESVKAVGDFAFESSGITSVNLTLDGVVIGAGAFYDCTSLKTAVIGKGATVSEYAFSETPIQSVDLLGGGVTVLEAAFYACEDLTSFDFADLSGRLGDFAFFGCIGITDVEAPYVTELGECCFANCYNLASFSAESLEIIGNYAFSLYTEDVPHGASITTIHAPNLTKVGDYAFYACYYLESIDLSGVTEIGTTAFALCSALESVTLSSELTELPELTFYECTALSGLDLSGIVRFGTGALYGVQLPAHLELTSAEYIDMQAFVEADGVNYIESVNAPKVTFIGEQAFAGCAKLTTLTAPKLEEIASAAFAATGISEFEIFDTLKTLGSSIFEGCESFTAYYTTVDGSKVYDKEYENVMIKDGVLYAVTPAGYVLMSYPTAKADKEFAVADGTVRIDYCAALGNKNIETLILPESLRYIGNHAFYLCDSLKKVVFKSYYAPVLEGTMTGDTVEITPETLSEYPGAAELYKYDYYLQMEDIVAYPLYYSNFIDALTTKATVGLTYVIPKNSSGYDSRIYKAYFTPVENEDSGIVAGPYALNFIDAVKKLPDVVDRFDEALINAAINAYNALEGKDDMQFVDPSYVEKFNEARSQYNVSVAENKINHLFDMDNSKYSYDIVKDARATYLALTDEERALVSNSAVLDTKIAELASAMGKTLDFSLSYEDYFPAPVEPPVDNDPPADDNGGKWWIAVVIGASVLAAAAAVGVFVFLKKKKAVTSEQTPDGDSEPTDTEGSEERASGTDEKED